MKRLLLLFFIVLIQLRVYGQTETKTYHVTWETHDQNMWGPNGSPFTMDTVVNLFDVNEADSVTAGSITQIFGGDFGAMLSIDYWLRLGLNFTIEGFTTGSIDARYPTIISLTYPDSMMFNPGQTITINSSYQVDTGWYLRSQFPTSGSISFDLYFGFNIDVDATVCVWSCTTFDVFEVGVPLDTTILFNISDSNGVASVTYPWYDPNIGFYFAHDTILPIIFNNLGGIGFSGVINLPYVETNDFMLPNDKCLYAKGDSAYIHLDLDLLQFLAAFDPDLAAIINQLNGTISLGGGISIDYSLLTMHLLSESYMIQDLTLCPTLWATLDFPMNFSFTETDPVTGTVVNAGTDDIITFQVDHDLNLDLPCNMPSHLPVHVVFSMDNDFNNHTWDSIAFTFVLTAFTFTLNLPSFPVLPDFCTPAYCINIPVPCAEKSGGPDTCYQLICIPEMCPPQAPNPQPDLSITIGPLINVSIPLGYIPLTWFNETWELAGFKPDNTAQGNFDTIVPQPFHMYPNNPFTTDIDGPNVICFGDTNAVITVYAINGTPPYTYVWNTGDSTTTAATSDSITVGVGSYFVTVTDANGCSSSESLIIYYINPEIFINLAKTDINCAGDSTGVIIATVTGGTPGYTYQWSPMGGTGDTAMNLPAGTYVLYVLDSVNCDKSDTITLIELHPLPPVNFYADVTSGCQPLVVQFTETSADQGQTYSWDYHDGGSDTIKNPQHIFTDYGTFDISLTVVSVFGCDSTMYKPGYITVHPKPVADFEANPSLVKKTENPLWLVQFDDHSGFTWFWDWNFGDPGSGPANTSDLSDPSHAFSGEDIYIVTLIVTSDQGCKDTTTRRVEVIDDVLQFSNVFTPNKDGVNDYFEIKNVEKYPENTLMIYDRWGVKVFETNHYRNNWAAEGIPDGVYYFVFNSGIGQKSVEGSVTIIR